MNFLAKLNSNYYFKCMYILGKIITLHIHFGFWSNQTQIFTSNVSSKEIITLNSLKSNWTKSATSDANTGEISLQIDHWVLL